MKKAQSLIEYLLILSFVAVVIGYGIAGHFDLRKIKNLIFLRPADSTNTSQIKIEAMTDIK